MADDDSGILAEFEEFLAAKRAQDQQETQEEDFEVEIWDEKGRGMRTRRSHAKPFLQSLGIDLDPEPPADDGKKPAGKPKATPAGRQSQAQSVTRKYFVRKTP